MTARGALRWVPQAALLAVAAAMAAMAGRFPGDADEHAGAGAFPLALCAALAVLAAARAAQKAVEGGTEPSMVGPGRRPGRSQGSRVRPGFEDVPPPAAAVEPGPPGGPGAWRLPALCVVYMAVLPWLGFIASTALFAAGMLAAMGYRRAGRALAFGLALAILLHWVFGVWMQVPLPEGWLG